MVDKLSKEELNQELYFWHNTLVEEDKTDINEIENRSFLNFCTNKNEKNKEEKPPKAAQLLLKSNQAKDYAWMCLLLTKYMCKGRQDHRANMEQNTFCTNQIKISWKNCITLLYMHNEAWWARCDKLWPSIHRENLSGRKSVQILRFDFWPTCSALGQKPEFRTTWARF